jgi:hypothetical protein
VTLFRQAVVRDPDNPALLSDFAYAYLAHADERFIGQTLRAQLCDQAISLLEVAATKPNVPENTYSFWAIALYYKGDYAQAWVKVHEAEKLGGRSINPKLVADLSAKMPRPAPLGAASN